MVNKDFPFLLICSAPLQNIVRPLSVFLFLPSIFPNSNVLGSCHYYCCCTKTMPSATEN